MSGRRRRGRRGSWDPAREGSGPSEQRRFGAGGQAGAPASQHGRSGYAPPPDVGRSGHGPNTQPQARWQRDGRPRRPQRPPEQRESRRPEPPSGTTIDPFELFCAYHLGITATGAYRIQNIHEVARRFGTNAAALRQTLAAYGMDAEDLVHGGFDLASAQIDIMVAPEGISRRELARPLYEEFKQAPRKARDWAKEMEEADRQIERTIGSEGRWSPSPRRP